MLEESFILYLPKAIVAGDFYWIREIGDHVYFATSDCTGHGVPGAMVSVVYSNALNRSVEEFGLTETGEILDKTADLLIETFAKNNQEVKDGMDISLFHWDRKENKFSFSGANNPLYIVRTKQRNEIVNKTIIQNETAYLIEIKGDKQDIGWTAQRKKFQTHQLEIRPGDMVYSITDGFPDQFGGEGGKKYKHKKFKEFLIEIAEKDMNEQHHSLMLEFQRWKGNLEQVDDVCIIGYRAKNKL